MRSGIWGSRWHGSWETKRCPRVRRPGCGHGCCRSSQKTSSDPLADDPVPTSRRIAVSRTHLHARWARECAPRLKIIKGECYRNGPNSSPVLAKNAGEKPDVVPGLVEVEVAVPRPHQP